VLYDGIAPHPQREAPPKVAQRLFRRLVPARFPVLQASKTAYILKERRKEREKKRT
jgi:hypothetical protein